ncbi:MAG: hypothetical protein H7A23_23070 [Leptospiraceae bacterium]|nr:hypothetical protein [Leptospiraceae bacterium]MCP5497448.1 hypothetical protein [Leptospiraceae bacterium]
MIRRRYFNILFVVLVLLVFFPFLETGFTTNDDSINQLRKNIYDSWKGIAFEQGRIQFLLFHWWLIWFSYISNNFIIIKMITLSMVIGNIIYFSYFLFRYTESKYIGIFFSILYISFLQDTWEHYLITSSPLIYTTAFMLFLFSLNLFIEFKNNHKKKYLYFSGLALFFALQISEMYFLLFILFPIVNLKYTQKIREQIKDMLIPFGFYFIYFFIYIIFRYFFADGSTYDGNQVADKFSFFDFIETLFTYSLSSFPGYYFLNGNFAYTQDLNIYLKFENILLLQNRFYENFISGVKFIQLNFYQLKTDWLIKYIIFSFVMMTTFTKKLRIKNDKILLLISIVLMFFPNIPHALTAKYQSWVVKSGSMGYVGTYISYFGISLLLSIGLNYLFSYFQSKKIKTFILSMILLLLLPISIFTSMTNESVIQSKVMTHKKWEMMNKFMKTQAFKTLDSSAIIYAPTLSAEYRGIVNLNASTYWSNYVYMLTGKEFRIIDSLDKIDMKKDNLYYLEYNQNRYKDGQVLIFGKVETIVPFNKDVTKLEIYSKQISVFPYTKDLNLRIDLITKSKNSNIMVITRSANHNRMVFSKKMVSRKSGIYSFPIIGKGIGKDLFEYVYQSNYGLLINHTRIEGFFNKENEYPELIFSN